MENKETAREDDIMQAIEFYRTTCETLEDLAKLRDVKNLDRYYQLSDYLAFPQLNTLGEMQQAFMQLAFHAQNASIISNIVKFKKNYQQLKAVLCDFEPSRVVEKYKGNTKEENAACMVQDFRNAGFTWNREKSTKTPDAIMTRYAIAMLDAAKYLSGFHSKQELLDDLMSNYENGNTESLVKYFKTKITKGFSVALTCDFLKEFAIEFCDLPKPDVHIMDTMRVLLNREKKYYDYDKGAFRCIKDLQDLVGQINCELRKANEKEITVYQMDRMILLICADNFFLEETDGNIKDCYLAKLK